MSDYSISFPHLGIYLDYVPKSFSVFGVTIAFYGVIIGLGMFLALCYCLREAEKTGQKKDDYWDLFVWLILCSVIGARIYYVIFDWEIYKDDLLSIFNIRGGGLAIYGGVLAGALTLFVFSKVKKLSFFQMADTVIPGLLIGQILGRYGNFTNWEAFGDYTDGLFAMRLPLSMVRQRDLTENILSHVTEGVDYIQVHPTFLYESLWNLMVLLLILFFKRKKSFEGELLAWYFIGYGLGRVWIEGMRTDSLMVPGMDIRVSQILALILIAVGILMIIVENLKKKKEK